MKNEKEILAKSENRPGNQTPNHLYDYSECSQTNAVAPPGETNVKKDQDLLDKDKLVNDL